MSRSLVVVLLAFSALLAVPAGSAQQDHLHQFTVDVRPSAFPEPIEPVRGVGHVPVRVDVRCGPPALAPLDPIPLDLRVVVNEPWAQATISPLTTFLSPAPHACLEGYHETVEAQVDFTFTQDAPAFARATFYVTAEVPYAEEARASWMQTADQYFHTNARFEQSIVRASANEAIQLPLTVQNYGNGDIQAIVLAGDATSPELNTVLPSRFVVPAFGGETTVQVGINTPDGFDGARRDQLDIRIHPISIDDTSRRDAPLQVNAVIVTNGTNGSGSTGVEELPGPGVAGFVGLAGVAVAALRRRVAG